MSSMSMLAFHRRHLFKCFRAMAGISTTGKLRNRKNIDKPGTSFIEPAEKKSKRQHVKVNYEQSCEKSQKSIEKLVDEWVPPHWEKIVENIREMRKDKNAPVDVMGCDKCSDEKELPQVVRFQVLVSLMLSSQTRDEITFATMQKLKEHGLTVENIIKTDEETLGSLIRQVGFWKTKVKYIKKTVQILRDNYSDDIPKSVEELCKLPGVGPKMAHLCMNSAWGEVTGIGVDTHVHRISNRLNWVGMKGKGTKTPEQTRKSLESWLPYCLWEEVNHLLVGFGQTICRPVNPHCSTCLNNTLCPYGKNDLKKKKK